MRQNRLLNIADYCGYSGFLNESFRKGLKCLVTKYFAFHISSYSTFVVVFFHREIFCLCKSNVLFQHKWLCLFFFFEAVVSVKIN